jgi:alanyl-tRNA synthetase
LDDWIVCVTSWGLPADVVAAVSGCEIPLNLWYTIDYRQQSVMKAVAPILYSTTHLPPTINTYYANHKEYSFQGSKILEVMPNLQDNNSPSIVILDKSPFYPTSGGQQHDTGKFVIDGVTYDVVDVQKVGPCCLHVVSPPLPADVSLKSFIGKDVSGEINFARRNQLRNHHTATHIIFAACRRILGPHVWQNGANKKVEEARLDITHFSSLTPDQIVAIETEANRIVSSCKTINKSFMPKDEAEGKFGMTLYQGGVVPGNELRVVQIEDTDTEACCGTHCDNTAEVGMIKILRANRISDGILRLTYVAGEMALKQMNHESDVLNQLRQQWSVSLDDIVPAGIRFFDGYKQLGNVVSKQQKSIFNLQLRVALLDEKLKLSVISSTEPNPTMFISLMPEHAASLKAAGKGFIAVGESWIYGLLGDAKAFDVEKQLGPVLAKLEEAKKASAKADDKAKMKPVQLKVKTELQVASSDKKVKTKTKVSDVVEFVSFALYDRDAVIEHILKTFGGVEI